MPLRPSTAPFEIGNCARPAAPGAGLASALFLPSADFCSSVFRMMPSRFRLICSRNCAAESGGVMTSKVLVAPLQQHTTQCIVISQMQRGDLLSRSCFASDAQGQRYSQEGEATTLTCWFCIEINLLLHLHAAQVDFYFPTYHSPPYQLQRRADRWSVGVNFTLVVDRTVVRGFDSTMRIGQEFILCTGSCKVGSPCMHNIMVVIFYAMY